MSDQHDKELEELFPQDISKVDLKRVVKKARRLTVLRNVTISVVTSIVVIAGSLILNARILTNIEDRGSLAAFWYKEISIPNVFLGDYHATLGLFGGQLQYQTFKVIEGVPIPWGTETYTFNILGNFSHMNGNDGTPSPQFSTSDGIRAYNYQTQQREMAFYYPGVKYSHYFNDLPQLKHIPIGNYAEMAISLDKQYDFNQIKAMMPSGVHPVWYWVDTYNRKSVQSMKQQLPQLLPMMPYEVYGFGSKLTPDDTSSRTPQSFIEILQYGLKLSTGSYHYDFEQVYNVLSHGKGHISPSDVKIIGVVVTATPVDLMKLQGKPFVKAAVLGAIANPYHS